MGFKSEEPGVDALVSAMGALVFATVRRLPPTEQNAFVQDLHNIAAAEAQRGADAAAEIIGNLHRAAELARHV